MESITYRTVPVTDLRQDIDGALEKTSKRSLLKIVKRGREIGILMRPEIYEELTSQIQTLQNRL